MAIQTVLDGMQGYKYMQYIQFNYLQIMNINCKKLFRIFLLLSYISLH